MKKKINRKDAYEIAKFIVYSKDKETLKDFGELLRLYIPELATDFGIMDYNVNLFAKLINGLDKGMPITNKEYEQYSKIYDAVLNNKDPSVLKDILVDHLMHRLSTKKYIKLLKIYRQVVIRKEMYLINHKEEDQNF